MLNRRRVYEILDTAVQGDRVSYVADLFVVGCIILSAAAIVLESMPSLGERFTPVFRGIEYFVLAVFTVEYGLRWWSIVEASSEHSASPLRARLRYMVSFYAIIDLIAILPTYLSFVFPFDGDMFRALRILRLFKLAHYIPSLRILTTVLANQAKTLAAILIILGLMLVLTSSGIYAFERAAQPDSFASIPAAMWWAVATLTTVGYGDVTPITDMGKIFAALVTLIGIGIVALPAGLLASGFSEELSRRHKALEAEIRAAMVAGPVTVEDHAALVARAAQVNIDESALAQMMDEVEVTTASAPVADVCPHCGKPIV